MRRVSEKTIVKALETLAERVADARASAGLSQAALAQKAGVTQSTIGNIESGGRKNPRELLAIAAALGVSAEWLKTGKPPRHAAPPSYWPFSISPAEIQALDKKQLARLEKSMRARLDELAEDAGEAAEPEVRLRKANGA